MTLDRAKFTTAVEALCAAFGQPASPAVFHAYWIGLSELTVEQLDRALLAAIRGSKFMPRPAELLVYAGVVAAPAEAAADLDARLVAAWAVVQETMGRFGSYASVDFEDVVINAAIRATGGWEALGQQEADEVSPWARKRFEDAYRASLRLDLGEDATAPLPGILARVNAGRADAPPSIPAVVSCSYLGAARPLALVAGGKR